LGKKSERKPLFFRVPRAKSREGTPERKPAPGRSFEEAQNKFTNIKTLGILPCRGTSTIGRGEKE